MMSTRQLARHFFYPLNRWRPRFALIDMWRLTLAAVVLTFCLSSKPLFAEDLSSLLGSGKCRLSYSYQNNKDIPLSVVAVDNAMGDNDGFVVTIPKAGNRSHYATVTFDFDHALDLSGFSAIRFYAKTAQKVPVGLTLICKGGGRANWTYAKTVLSGSFQRLVFNRSEMTATNEPDLSMVTGLSIGLGLWAYDNTKEEAEITFVSYEGTDVALVIPRPTRGVVIDGEYKDWGYENSLYHWTPPDYIYLNNKTQLFDAAAADWKGPEQLSGRFSFMKDDENLYFLGVVTDETPFEGAVSNLSGAPFAIKPIWKNDSIELFLVTTATSYDLRHGASLRDTGIQIVFDCGARHEDGNTLVLGKIAKDAGNITSKVVPSTSIMDGKQVKGYVLEASIPLAMIPGAKKLTRGAMMPYSIKLNDSSGRRSLLATPENQSPYATVNNFLRAYIEVASYAEDSGIKFGRLAHEPLWPEIYCKGKTRPRIWDMEKCSHKSAVSATISRTYLHGMWAAQAVKEENTAPDPDKWIYTPQPMGIGSGGPAFELQKDNPDELGKESEIWCFSAIREYSFFWFERTFRIDPAVKAAKTFLVFEYANKEATVYLNGNFIGLADPAGVSFDVSEALIKDKPNRLDVLLYTTPLYSPRNPICNGTYGMIGDIYIEQHANPPKIKDIWIKDASGIDGGYVILVETERPGQDAEILLELLDTNGVVLAKTREKVVSATNTTVLRGRCAKFKPWSPESPRLFNAKVSYLENGRLIDERIQRFGFRSFEIKDGRFLMNGNPIRLRATWPTAGSGSEPGCLEELKRYGHNSIFRHASDFGFNRPLFERLDEAGLLAFAPTDRAWPDRITIAEIRKHRNHPSVIGYVSDSFGQFMINGFQHNPFSTSDTYYPESAEAQRMYSFLRRRFDLFRSVDPTRPYFPHATGNFEGSLRSNNHYPAFGFNLLDRMMYFHPWSQRKEKILPYHLYECGMSLLHGLDSVHPENLSPTGYGKNLRMAKRSLVHEQASCYLGVKAFDDWQKMDVAFIRASVRGLRMCGIDGFTPWVNAGCFLAPVNYDKAIYTGVKDNRSLSYEYFTLPFKEVYDDTWMRVSSKTYSGITDWLGARAKWQWPEKYGQGRIERKETVFTHIYEHDMQPFAAWIAGPIESKFSFGHNYYAGETIKKQIAFINDTERDLEVSCPVSLEIGGKTNDMRLNASLTVGEIKMVPFEFQAPRVAERTEGIIRLKYNDPATGDKREDTLAVTIFPQHAGPVLSGRIGVVKGSAEDKGLLDKTGIKAEVVSLSHPISKNLDLLIIERNALNKDVNGEILRQYLENGGRVLVLEQTDKGLLDWRLRERRLESVFMADARHPVLRGLKEHDLSYFRGAAAIVPGEKGPSKFYRHGGGLWLDVMHLTNEGIVASFVMQKPAYGKFRPILVAGYDLEEVALLEAYPGKGYLLMCQIDVTDRYGLDPAATMLVDNIFVHMLETEPSPEQKTVAYTGGTKGEKMLNRLGVVFSPAAADQAYDVLAVGEKADARIIQRAKNTVIILPFSEYLPAGISTGKVRCWSLAKNIATSLSPAPDRLGEYPGEIFRGIVDNDVYFFESPVLSAFEFIDEKTLKCDWRSEHGTMAEGRAGDAKYILCSVDPYALQEDECRRKAWRIWSVIFANADAPSRFNPTWTVPSNDISQGAWTFLTDPDGTGDKLGFASGNFGGNRPRPIKTGVIWEEQGVTNNNPNIDSPPDSAYDGFGWYFRTFRQSEPDNERKMYLFVAGSRDIVTGVRTNQATDLWINGERMPPPIGVYNVQQGGIGGRLWELPVDSFETGKDDFIAIRIFNRQGAGGIHRRPVMFETGGQNQDMLFPYEFIRSKYEPYFFWVW